jgi:sugar/nucleoside kinase (ribokinase family)
MAKVGCAGILVADTFCGPMKELPPEGHLTAIDDMPTRVGGCAANVAIDLVKQGLAVEVLGCLGQDASGAVVRSSLAEAGLGCDQLVTTADYPTSRTVILLVEGQDRRFIHVFGANRALSAEHLRKEWLAGLDAFYLGGLFAMPGIKPEALRPVLQFCREKGVVTIVDVVIPHDAQVAAAAQSLLPWIDYFLPNDDEARLITGEQEPAAQLRRLLACGAGTVVITLDGQGSLCGRGDTYWQAGAYAVDVVDPSGAGDAFAAGVVAGVVQKWDVPQVLRYASALGASAARAVGTTTSVFTLQEALAFIEHQPLAVATGKLERPGTRSKG